MSGLLEVSENAIYEIRIRPESGIEKQEEWDAFTAGNCQINIVEVDELVIANNGWSWDLLTFMESATFISPSVSAENDGALSQFVQKPVAEEEEEVTLPTLQKVTPQTVATKDFETKPQNLQSQPSQLATNSIEYKIRKKIDANVDADGKLKELFNSVSAFLDTEDLADLVLTDPSLVKKIITNWINSKT